MLPSSSQPGTIISRTPSRQAHSGEFVTIQGKDTTFKSGDILVPEIVSAMETKNPGITQGVESVVYKTNGSRERLTDVDIVTQNELFQVKTGSAKGLLKQLNETSTIPGGRKVVAIVTKDARRSIVTETRDAGYEVIVIENKNDINKHISQILRQRDN
jgi:hypothetical protein